MHDSGNGLNWLIGFILLIFAIADLINSHHKPPASIRFRSSGRYHAGTVEPFQFSSRKALILAHSFFDCLFSIHGGVEDTGDLYPVPLFNVIRNVMCNWKRP